MSVGVLTVRLNRPHPRRRKQNLKQCPEFCSCYAIALEAATAAFSSKLRLDNMCVDLRYAMLIWVKSWDQL